MAKEAVAKVKLMIPAGQATPAPPVGPALGQHGVNIMEFCKQFNAQTQQFSGELRPVEITIYKDKSFSFVVKQPPVSFLLMKYAKIDKGSTSPGKAVAGKIKMEDVRKIAEQKLPEMNSDGIEAAIRTVLGSAKSMGLEIVD
ncbi:MAG: 50S ribosomal protein L11 [Deltaproteobacteria bacterium]|nr:50S ribosomal protein L11 [Deltaproteobacteria bacterium]MCX7952671.1 50S ribosomal protein L11 [Deltaproteobacteria bacterium]